MLVPNRLYAVSARVENRGRAGAYALSRRSGRAWMAMGSCGRGVPLRCRRLWCLLGSSTVVRCQRAVGARQASNGILRLLNYSFVVNKQPSSTFSFFLY